MDLIILQKYILEMPTNNRYLALDFARLMAIFFMIQGHTIGSIVNPSEITNLGFTGDIWMIIRSVTSATFLIVSGMVNFIGIKRNQDGLVDSNIIWKRCKRALLLLLIDYLLIFPVTNMSQFSMMSQFDWFNFFKVGTLNIIAISLLTLIIIMNLTKSNKQLAYSSLFFGLILIISTPFFHSINWFQYVHPYFGHYLTQSGGSNFSYPSHAPFLFIGTFLGYFLADYLKENNSTKISMILVISGSLISLSGLILSHFIDTGALFYNSMTSSPFIIFTKIGYSFILIGLYFFLSKFFKNYEKLIGNLSKNNIITYTLHIIFIFGTPWTIGLIYYFQAKTSLINGIIATILITLTSFSLTFIIGKFKINFPKLYSRSQFSLIIIILNLILFLNTKIILF